ncbi:MAG: hypothetical protein JJLCMIEE_03051 [Acidimicrobiales bacterium]|nr:MAG: DUF3179 domain-containing protein [Actinomycetota bacterium]MBV6509935.1 hypothetical protein [Acidimicrobiales bacterium]RIK08574.1 MAG: hypothetical protein DCC48_01130 [Acidobacteriota bacterium]
MVNGVGLLFGPLLTIALTAAACSSATSQEQVAADHASEEEAGSTTVAPGDSNDDQGSTAADTFDEDYLMLNGGAGTAIDDPAFIPADEVSWLDDDDVVLGWVSDDGGAYAFPVMQMAYHHIAQGDISGEPYLVTY